MTMAPRRGPLAAPLLAALCVLLLVSGASAARGASWTAQAAGDASTAITALVRALGLGRPAPQKQQQPTLEQGPAPAQQQQQQPAEQAPPLHSARVLAAFEAFKVEYGKTYPAGSPEHASRLEIFAANMAWIEAHNEAAARNAAAEGAADVADADADAAAAAGGAGAEGGEEDAAAAGAKPPLLGRRGHGRRRARRPTWLAGVNEFADLTWEEFAATRLGASPGAAPQAKCSATARGNHAMSAVPPPEAQDWRAKGVVTGVKNQQHCGSCWTFSSTGALEASHALLTGALIALSEQQLVDCAGSFDNHGCRGGLPSHAFEYVRYAGGIATEAAYPYLAADGPACKFLPSAAAVFVSDVVNITEGAEDELRDAVGNLKPVSVAFQVLPEFRFYKSGIYSSTECKTGPDTVNHAVLAVGYATGAAAGRGPPHWVIKNSWSAAWGMAGYFLMAMGTNECGISTCASYPVMEARR